MGQKKRFRIVCFRRKGFRSSSWSENLEQAEEEVIKKKVIREIVNKGDAKTSPGRTDVRVQMCPQKQTLCRLETSMDNCVAAVTAAIAAYRRHTQKIKNINHLALVLRLLDK